MENSQYSYFITLKKDIAATFRKSFPGAPEKIEEWRGQTITDFQEDLMAKTKGRLSEKWFYTHIKSGSDKLPRIDMLNILSEYTGYKNWDDYVFKQKQPEEQPIQNKQEEKAEQKIPEAIAIKLTTEPVVAAQEQKGKNRKQLYFIVAFFIVLVIGSVLSLPNERVYKCCFVDLDGVSTFKNMNIQVKVLVDGESPVYISSGESGCIEVKTKKEQVRFVISSPYFKNDTIVRTLENSLTEEKIRLKTDDYALMLSYFSSSNVQDWQKRKAQLSEMFADNARITEVLDQNTGVELYNKEEFINKITMPLRSLKGIEILDVKYNGEKIVQLRFKTNPENR